MSIRSFPVHRTLRLLPPLAVIVTGASLSFGALPSLADPSYTDRPALAQTGCLDKPLVTMADSGVTGSARLCIVEDGVRAQIATSNLAADNAYTVWFVYFDRPSTCKTQLCSPPDVIGEDPPGVLGRMDALVADGSGAGAFEGDLRGMQLSSGSHVHLPIFGHGPANTEDYRARARQLLTPEDPMLGAPGLGVVAAHPHAGPVAVAIFEIP